VHNRITSAVKRVDLVSDGIAYITLRDRRCDVVVLNSHAPTENKSYCVKDSFYAELQYVFYEFPIHNTIILLGDFNVNVDKGHNFKATIKNDRRK
jgi:hypothetical protein